jgi:hypothetical protein
MEYRLMALDGGGGGYEKGKRKKWKFEEKRKILRYE